MLQESDSPMFHSVSNAYKHTFYLIIQLGAGSFLLHQFSMLVNTILVNFGLSEEMHNPVSSCT